MPLRAFEITDPNLNYYGKNYKYGLKLASIMAPQGFIIELHQIIDDNPSTFNELIDRGYQKRVEHFYPGGSWTIIDSEQALGVNLNIKPAM